MLPQDFFLQLPGPMALLLLSSLIDLTSAHVARQTPTTIPYRPLNVAAYPPLPAPTSPPLDGRALNVLLGRQDTNTVCGYINGDSSLPATCSAGSHCVVDTDHGVVGCCPNGEEACTTGVFTGCVDSNSGPQTDVNPYVFTCTGANVCYQNTFDGGYSQFGCGSASTLAATVAASASGVAVGVTLTSQNVALTQSPSTLATPTTIGTHSGSSSGDPTGSSGSSSSSASSDLTTLTVPSPSTATDPALVSSTTSTSSAAATATAAPGTSEEGGGVNRTGAIVGGSIAGVAVLAGLVAVAAFFLRRRAGNSRQGPGPRPGDTQYISPVSGGASFAPLGQGTSGGRGATVGGRTITHHTGEPASRNTVWQYGNDGDHRDYQPGFAAAAGLGAAAGAGAYREGYASPRASPGEDQVPLRSPELDDFSSGFHDALSRIGEEDEEQPEDGVNGAGMSGGATGDLGDNSRPLWLQSRRQSRNLMWT